MIAVYLVRRSASVVDRGAVEALIAAFTVTPWAVVIVPAVTSALTTCALWLAAVEADLVPFVPRAPPSWLGRLAQVRPRWSLR